MDHLNGKRIVLIGGDARQLEVTGILVGLGAVVELIGFDRIQDLPKGAVHKRLETGSLARADAVILPVAGMDDDGKVEGAFSTSELILTTEMIAALPEHASIITGIAKGLLKARCKEYGVHLTEIMDRDDIAIYNSIPTAEGAIMVAIQNTDFTIHGSTCLVLGLGRVGLTLAKTLAGLGAKVKAGVRRPEEFARAVALGLHAFYTTDLKKEAEEADMVFNTVPAMMLTAEVIGQLPKHSLIVDLASKPGGTDFRAAEEHGIKAILALGLPGLVAPRTAGRIFGNVIAELLLER